MNSVWSSLLPTHGAPALAYVPAAAPDPATGPVLPHPSIWSRIPLATDTRAAAATSSTADAAQEQSHPPTQLFHPRYIPGDKLVSKKLAQTRVKPLEVSPHFGSAGLTERPQQALPLWGDSTRARMPHTADVRRVRSHNAEGRELFDVTPAAPTPAAAAPVPVRRALHPDPPSDVAALANLRLTNPSTHVPRGPSQLLPFATLTASVRPSPLSAGGFRPLIIEAIQERWAHNVGVQKPNDEQHTTQEQQQQQQPQRRSALRKPKPMEEEKEQQEQQEQDRPASARQRQRADMATSPMAQVPRGGLALGKQQPAAEQHSVALSPMPSPRREAAGITVDLAPASDAHIIAQSERVHKYSVAALKAQLEDLKREERAIDREHRAAQKSALHAQAKWEGLVGLSTVAEADQSVDASAVADSDPSAPLRHALALDDEREAGTQTDGTLELRHPRKPRVAGRKGSSAHDDSKSSTQQKIEAEVAREFEQKRAATFGVPKTRPGPVSKPGTGALPPFKSYADSYREQLQKQYQVVFDAQVAAAQHPPDSRAGQLVEARLKRMRDDLLFATNPYRSAQEYHRRTAALAEAEADPSRSPEEAMAEAMEQQYHASLDLPVPETIIGSRTAALLFTDPNMMQRKTAPNAAEGAAFDQLTNAPNPHTSDIPNKIVQFTEQNRAALKDALGFEIPRPTFPENRGADTTHMPLRFQPVRPHDPNHVPIPLQRLTSAQIQSVGPEVEALFRVDDKISEMDLHSLFAGARPMRALKSECVDLDNDVARLENTIRALHAEFSSKTVEERKPVAGEHVLVPGYDEMRGGGGERARSNAADGVPADARQLEAAQAYLNQMDRVIGVPSLASPRASRSNSAAALHSGRSSAGTAPLSPHQSRARLPFDRRSSATDGGVGAGATSAPGTTTSKLVAALEQYLSLEIPADMLPPSQPQPTQALRAQPPDHTAATLHSFPVAPHDLNRLPDFTPQSLSPSYAKTKQSQQQSNAGPLSPSRKQQQVPQSRSAHVHHSWESDLLSAQQAAAADEREQAHVEQMLQEQMNDLRMTPDYHRKGSNQPPRPSSRQSPSGMRASAASLSRVTESEHEDSRSHGSATDRSGKSPQAQSQHRPTQMQIAPPLSGSRVHRGGGGPIDYEDSNDSTRWSESGEEDQSIVLHVPQHQQPVPFNFEDSMESNPPQLNARHAHQLQQHHQPQQSQHQQHQQPLSGRDSLSRTQERPRALLSPSAAQQQRSPTHHAVSVPASLARPLIEPRTNRAAELKKAQLAQQQQRAEATPPRSPRSPRRQQQPQPQHPQPSIQPSHKPPQADRAPTNATAEPVVARKKSAIELERERRRMKQLQGSGMMRSSQDRLQSPVAAAPTRSAAVNLSSSNDRLLREAHAMMDQFRAQMDAMPDLPGESEQPQHTQHQYSNPYHSEEFRPDLNHRESYQQQQRQHELEASWEHDVQAAPIAPAHHANDEDDNVWYSHPPAIAQSWEDELAKADDAHNSARDAMQRNPLDDDDDDLFR